LAGDIDRPPSRGELNRLLVANALTKPFPNVLLPALIAAAGLIAGLGALGLVVAVVTWLALSAITYFDGDEAERVSGEMRAKRRQALDAKSPRITPAGLAPPVAARLQAVLDQQGSIAAAIQRAELPFAEVAGEVDVFVRAAEKTAGRAELLYEFLSDNDPRAVDARLASLKQESDPSKQALVEALQTQQASMKRAADQLDRFYTEMERIAVELGNVRGELLSVSAASEGAEQTRLAADVRDLREQMGAVSAGMSEALEQTGDA
jgi:hypothetical protein